MENFTGNEIEKKVYWQKDNEQRTIKKIYYVL